MTEHMPLIAILSSDTVPERAEITDWRHRNAARAVLLNDQGEVALMHVANEGYYKLPGGGFDDGESAEEALAREVTEETGHTDITVVRPIGLIDEYILERQMYQRSYCYLVRTTGQAAASQLTNEETQRGFGLVWAPSMQAALETVEAAQPAGVDGQRIRARDAHILQAALALSV